MEEGGFTAYSGLSARVPPDHTRIRKIVQKAFTPRRYKVLEPSIRAHVVRMVEDLLAHEDRARRPRPGPGLRRPDRHDPDPHRRRHHEGRQFKTWSDSRAAMTWGDLTDEQQVPHAHHLVDYWQECQRLVTSAHETHPDSLVGDLVRAQDAGEEITDHEIASICYSLLFAGHETTTTLISNTLRVLLGHPDQWDLVRDEPLEGRPGHRRGAPLQPLDRGVAPQGVA